MNIVGKSLEDLLTSADPKDRVLGRYYATGVMETVEKWITAEMNLPGRNEETTGSIEAGIVHTLMFSFVATVCSFVLACGRMDPDVKVAADGFGKIVADMYAHQMPLHQMHRLREMAAKMLGDTLQ